MLKAACLVVALAVGSSAAFAAQLGPPGPPGPAGPPGPRPPGPPPALFISPAGELFSAAPGGPYPVAAWFARADRDGDRYLSLREFLADAGRFAASLDINGDRVIDGYELRRHEWELDRAIDDYDSYDDYAEVEPPPGPPAPLAPGGPPGPPAPPGPPGPFGPPRPPGTAAPVPPSPHSVSGPPGPGFFSLLDEAGPLARPGGDLSRRIGVREVDAFSRERFRRLDRNGDGRLSLRELPPTGEQRMVRSDRG